MFLCVRKRPNKEGGGWRLIDSLVKCDRTTEHGESECESKRNGQANMLLFSDLGEKTDLWVHGRASSTTSFMLINNSLYGHGKQSNI